MLEFKEFEQFKKIKKFKEIMKIGESHKTCIADSLVVLKYVGFQIIQENQEMALVCVWWRCESFRGTHTCRATLCVVESV